MACNSELNIKFWSKKTEILFFLNTNNKLKKKIVYSVQLQTNTENCFDIFFKIMRQAVGSFNSLVRGKQKCAWYVRLFPGCIEGGCCFLRVVRLWL